VISPRLGQIQATVDQRVPAWRGIGHKHRHLGILDPPGSATVLALHADGVGALLDIGGLIDNQHRVRITEGIDHVVTQIIADRISIPFRA